MADEKKYISVINYDGKALFVKDADAQTAIGNLQTTVSGHTSEINNIKTSITGAMHYIGASSTPIVEGSVEGPWKIGGIDYNVAIMKVASDSGSLDISYIRAEYLNEEGYYAWMKKFDESAALPLVIYVENATPSMGDTAYIKSSSSGNFETYSTVSLAPSIYHATVEIKHGYVATYKPTGKEEQEYVYGPTGWEEFGSTGSLKALAFKDLATGTVKAAGGNASSLVTFTSGSGSNFVTGFDTAPAAPSFTEGTFSAGTLPSFTEGAFSAGTLPSFTEGAFSAGTLPSLGAATTGTFATEGVTVTYTEGTETLAFGTATTSSAVTAQGTFTAGTLPSKAADTFSAGTLPSKGADSFSAGTLPSKSADTFSAGTVPTLATAKALTASDTGTAAAQTFTGTDVTVTVS